MKRLMCIVLCLCLAAIMPVQALGEAETGSRIVNNSAVEIDADGSDGYSGDYVVIYNPSTSDYSSASTGNMTGLIETELNTGTPAATIPGGHFDEIRPFKRDIDAELAAKAKESGLTLGEHSERSLSFDVGDTYDFELNFQYCPLYNTNVEFEVLAKGEHCYVWSPTSTAANVYPLDEIDESFADICAAEFDSKFELMRSSFGEHDNGQLGDGRLNLLYYNIDCGWQPGESYVAGFFSAFDYYMNGMPCLNIDTYPGVYYVDEDGEVSIDISETFSTTVHEYQHLINYSVCGSSSTWINECLSAAAEEICYPGSSLSIRIPVWLNYDFDENEDWLNPPLEHEYSPDLELHNGFSLYQWDNWLDSADTLAMYAQVSLYAQYIYSQYGNETFRALLESLADTGSFNTSFQRVTGKSASEFTRDFRIALTANAPIGNDGLYGFKMQEGYDPQAYHGVQNLYNWLAPIVFTGRSCDIGGGGAITVKPTNGVYYPPTDANAGLEYYGISFDSLSTELGDVDMNGIIDITDALIVLRKAINVTSLTEEQEALADYDGDGIVTIADALEILRVALNSIT